MNKTKYLALAFAALTLGACTSDDVAVKDDPNIVQGGEKGYVSLAINLPTQPSTRATTDNSATLDDGDAVEYNVNDATLLVFVGEEGKETEAKFAGAYSLDEGLQSDDLDDDHITSTYTYVQSISMPTIPAGQTLLGLVVLNKGGVLTNEGTNWTLHGTQLTSSTTFADVNAAMTLNDEDATTGEESNNVLDVIASRTGSGNFLMTNAPLYTKQGGTADPTSTSGSSAAGKLQTLVEIDPSKVYNNKTDAERNPAANVYVERAVAKVTLNKAQTLDTSELPTGITAKIVGWTLDNTNKHTYLMRNVFEDECDEWWGYKADETAQYRFVGGLALENNSLYRTYWGVDPNYDGIGHDGTTHYVSSGDVISTQDEFNSLVGTAPADGDLSKLGYDHPLYCLENTFDTENMRKDQSTRVIVAVELGVDDADGNGDFFVLGGDMNTFYGYEDICTQVGSLYINALSTEINDALQPSQTLEPSDITVVFEKGTASSDPDKMGELPGGVITVKEVYVSSTANTKFKENTIPAKLKANDPTTTASINSSTKIEFYKGGVAYYRAIIEHFDSETETPWATTDGSDGNSYPGTNAARDWLGRWGVLRNNWYDIQVTSIRNLGTPDIETETGFNDPLDSWMSVRINILSWAKRSQSVDL